jgi:hypothetical protein
MQIMLPYRTDWRSIMTMLDYVKGKGADRSSLEARLGGGESFRETLNASEQIGLVERDEGGEIRLTRPGQMIAYAANDRERRLELASALVRYPPYQVPLERAAHSDVSVIDGPSVERVWQVDMRLSQPRNRVEEARTLFFRLADEAGLGTFRRGVRGQPTRLELGDDFPEIISNILGTASDEESSTESLDEPSEPVNVPSSTNLPEKMVLSQPSPQSGAAGVRLEITVDMTEWDLEKIEAFLEMVGMRARDQELDDRS